nr:MAG TPA: hypothetical protein [Caudoviricetes sp.]
MGRVFFISFESTRNHGIIAAKGLLFLYFQTRVPKNHAIIMQ